MKTKFYLKSHWILRYEPQINSSKYWLYNIHSMRSYQLNESLYLLLNAIVQGKNTIGDLANEFNEKPSDIQRYLNNIRGTWDGLISDIPQNYSCRNDELDRIWLEKYLSPTYSFPISAEVHLTENCNLRCRHCFYSCHPLPKVIELSAETWIKTFKEFESYGLLSTVLTGGEIFTYSEIDTLLEYLPQINVHFTLLTNGLKITQEQAKLLRSPNISLSISMDGCTAESHDYLRGKGAFSKLTAVIDMLTEEKVCKSLSVTLNAKNYKEIAGILDYAITHDCFSVGFLVLDENGRASEHEELHLTEDMYKESLQQINLLCKKYTNLNIQVLNPSSEIANIKQPSHMSNMIICSGANKHIAISSGGEMYPCVYAFGNEKYKAGNICDTATYELWRTDKWDEMRGKTFLSDLKVCGNCKLNMQCSLKNCRMRALAIGEDFYGKPNCRPMFCKNPID